MKWATRSMVVLVVLSLVSAACADEDAASTQSTTTTDYKPVDKTVEREVDIEISGARAGHVRRRLPVRLLLVRTPVSQSNLTSVTLLEPLDIGNGQRLLVDIALFGPDARKSSLTIAPGYGTAPPGAPKVSAPPVESGQTPSRVRLTILAGQPLTETLFAYHAEPCKITVRQPEALLGSATCDAVYGNGEKLAFRMTWDG